MKSPRSGVLDIGTVYRQVRIYKRKVRERYILASNVCHKMSL